jgi:putative membrane-bound dehydrogenase-like protein
MDDGGTTSAGARGVGWHRRLSWPPALACGIALLAAVGVAAGAPPRVATFRCDMTPPVGQPLFTGDALQTVAEPLLAKGVVLESGDRRVVICALDWCMVSNGTHLSMRRRLAAAVNASPDDVAVQTLHQHNAPMADIDAQRLLAQHGDASAHLDPEWLDAAERRLADAAREAVARLTPCDRVGTGKGLVEGVASNRRVRDAGGRVAGRTSLSAPPLRELPEGTIDPFVRTVTFAAGDKPLVRLHYYATHPQVKYNDGIATSDFVGLAREALERREGVFQIYFTGCGGDITVGKYNDGTPAARQGFADRLLEGMTAAIDATIYEPLREFGWRTCPLVLPRRDDPDFTAKVCLERIRDPQSSPVQKLYRSAMRVSSLHRAAEPIVLGCLEAGNARILHLPGEPLLDFQLYAQRICPDRFVAVAGYGDNTTGYIPPAAEFAAGGYEPSVAICKPEAEVLIKRGMADLLQVEPQAAEPQAVEPHAAAISPHIAATTQLLRVPPQEPAAALGTFTVAPGYRLEQVAAEPLVHSPVAVDFDERGRMFVVEMIDYSEQEHDHLGTIRILEDLDGDGRYDTSTVFAAGLSWPTGVLCYDGGVFVCAAPDILYCKDTDGDGIADERRVVFTGFGRSNVQGLLNSLRWSLDCRVHGATSSSGARVTRPDDPGFQAVNLAGRDFSFDPRTLDLRPESGCLQHGMSFDDWGRKFVSGNSQPLEMVLFEDRYAARNPLHVMPPARRSIAVDGGAAEVFRTSPVEAWRELRTRMRIANPTLGPVEGGGRAAGYFTGATGVTAYRGDAYPAEMRACLVVGDVGSNLVHRERLSAEGPFLEARRIDPHSEFVASSDIWFRPAQFANAPDGTLHILDVYREVIEHPKAFPPEIKRQLDLTSGCDRGRIYRIVPAGHRGRTTVDLAAASTAALVETLAHRNGWHRDTAARLLVERRPADAGPLLARLAGEATLPEGRMHALYVLAALGRLSPAVLQSGLADPHPRVREHAVRLAERWPEDASILTGLCGMTDDDDARVRYQLAFSLGEFPASGPRNDAFVRLAVRDGDAVYPRAAIMSSLVAGAGDVLAAVLEAHGPAAPAAMVEALAAQMGRQGSPEDVKLLEEALAGAAAGGSPVAAANAEAVLVGYLAGRAKAAADVRATPLPAALVTARQSLLDAARATAVDEGATEADRVAAVRRLALGSFAESRDAYAVLVESRQPQGVQLAAIESLAAAGDADIGAWLVDRWTGLSPRVRSAVGGMLVTREPWAVALLDAILAGRVPLADVDQAPLRLLAGRAEPAIRERHGRLAERLATSPRQEVLAAYETALSLPGDAERGRNHFVQVCAQCHRIDGVGHEVGPSLAAFKTRGPEAILLNMLDPNREVNPLYVNYVAVLDDGRTLTGMVAEETATSITLRRGEGVSDTVARSDIESLSSTGTSIMPEGIEKQLDPQAVADLLAYLLATP